MGQIASNSYGSAIKAALTICLDVFYGGSQSSPSPYLMAILEDQGISRYARAAGSPTKLKIPTRILPSKAEKTLRMASPTESKAILEDGTLNSWRQVIMPTSLFHDWLSNPVIVKRKRCASWTHTGGITNPNGKDDKEKDSLSPSQGCLCLYKDAFWPKECGKGCSLLLDEKPLTASRHMCPEEKSKALIQLPSPRDDERSPVVKWDVSRRGVTSISRVDIMGDQTYSAMEKADLPGELRIDASCLWMGSGAQGLLPRSRKPEGMESLRTALLTISQPRTTRRSTRRHTNWRDYALAARWELYILEQIVEDYCV
ncbi:hypothetical protein Tco_0373862 [Tanacetum coccineum]